MTGFGFAPPGRHPDLGGAGAAAPTTDDGPTIAVLYYRAQHLAGNTGYVEALCGAIEARGRQPAAGVLRVAAHRRTRTARTAAAPRTP